MSSDFQSIEALVDGVKGTTGLLSRLISRKSGFALLLIVAVVIVSRVFLV